MKNSFLVPKEEDEQAALVKWLTLKKIKFSAIPNGGYKLTKNSQNVLKKTGLRKGLPDLFCIINDSILFIEMKRANRRNKTSPEQDAWIRAINRCQNAEAIVAYGAEDAICQIEKIFPEGIRSAPEEDFVDPVSKIKGIATDLPF